MSEDLLPISEECKKQIHFACNKVVIQQAAQTGCSCKCHAGIKVS